MFPHKAHISQDSFNFIWLSPTTVGLGSLQWRLCGPKAISGQTSLPSCSLPLLVSTGQEKRPPGFFRHTPADTASQAHSQRLLQTDHNLRPGRWQGQRSEILLWLLRLKGNNWNNWCGCCHLEAKQPNSAFPVWHISFIMFWMSPTGFQCTGSYRPSTFYWIQV